MNNTIEDILFDEDENIRLSNGDRWLIGEIEDDGTRVFAIYERKYGARKTKTITRTTDRYPAIQSPKSVQ